MHFVRKEFGILTSGLPVVYMPNINLDFSSVFNTKGYYFHEVD